MENNTKSAFIAIVGRPNVGKSSLLNRFVGEKVAIVTPKPQTTRNRITGVLTKDDSQLVFIDTPGMHRPRTKLSEYMVSEVQRGVGDVDAVLLVTEPLGDIRTEEQELVRAIKARKIPAVLAINKIDTLPRKDAVLEKIAAFSALHEFDHLVPVSALSGDGVQALLDTMFTFTTAGPHFFDEDAYTDQPERVIVAEMLREQLLISLRDEIPHGVAVGIESMKVRPDGELVDISAMIYCEKDSHKGMIIGKSGAMLKHVAARARHEMESFLDMKVNLQCWVKVKDDWRNRPGVIKQFGFSQNQG